MAVCLTRLREFRKDQVKDKKPGRPGLWWRRRRRRGGSRVGRRGRVPIMGGGGGGVDVGHAATAEEATARRYPRTNEAAAPRRVLVVTQTAGVHL